MRRVFSRTPLIVGQEPISLDREASHYVRHVLRVPLGGHVDVFDSHGNAFLGEVTAFDATLVWLRVVDSGARRGPIGGRVQVTLWLGLTKGRKVDDVVRRATELGMSQLIPLVCKRSVARPSPERASTRVERWKRIAGEASRQCGRVDVPCVRSPAEVGAALTAYANEPDALRLLLWESEEQVGLRQAVEMRSEVGSISIAIGPEGGWDDAEVEQFSAAGFSPVSLGARILRADTAPVAALACVQLLVGELG